MIIAVLKGKEEHVGFRSHPSLQKDTNTVVGNKAGDWEYRFKNGKISRKESYKPAGGTGQRPLLKSVKGFGEDGLPIMEGNEDKITLTEYNEGGKFKEIVVKPAGRSKFRCEYFDEEKLGIKIRIVRNRTVKCFVIIEIKLF